VATTGKITGNVTDSSGAAVVDATVKVEGPALMAPRSATSRTDGNFLIDVVPIGTYTLTVTANGFKSFVQNNLALQAGFTATVNAVLEVGTMTQSVTVESAPVVDVQSVASSTTFGEAMLQNLPSGRDPWSTVAQAPGVTSSTFDVAGNQSFQQSTMQMHGSMPGEQVYSWNGLRLNWPGSNGGYTSFYVNHDSLQEFQVVSDQAPAEVGVGGIYMNMVTKSGSNQIHGRLSAYYLTSAFQAQQNLPIFKGQAVQAGTPFVMSRDTTGSVGMPLIKNRWWLFDSFRMYDIRTDVLSIRRPNGQPVNDSNHQWNNDTRSDWQVNSKNRASFVWLYNEQNRYFRRDTAYTYVSDQASWRQIEPAYILQGLWTSQLTSSLVLDFRIGYMHQIFPLSFQPSVPATAINRVDLTLSTEDGSAPYSNSNLADHGRVAVTLGYYKSAALGSHDVKFGYEGGRAKNAYKYLVNNDITAVYNNGLPTQAIVYNTPVAYSSEIRDAAAFVQDAWHVAKRLTLNLGVRYDRFRSYNPAQSSPAIGSYVSLFGARTFPQSADTVRWNNPSPRLGAAFDITGKGRSVIRAGFSRFYRMEGAELSSAVNPNTFSSRTYAWTGGLNASGFPTGFLNNAIISTSGGIFTTVDPNLKHPYSDEVTVSWEQQLFSNLSVGAGYYHRNNKDQIGRTSTTRLPTDYTAITSLNGAALVNPLTSQPLTLYNLSAAKASQANFYQVTNVAALDRYSYNAVEFTATKHMSQRWMVLAGLTIQRQKGTYGSGSPNALSDDFNNPNFDINRFDNNLFQDSTFVWKINGSYQMPWGISTALNFQHYTGYPFRPTQVFTGLNQGSVTIALLPQGSLRLPSVNMADLRVSRPFSFRERWKVEPIADLFNLGNSNTVLSQVSSYGSVYLRPSNVLSPFVARFGLRVEF
jgi:outer membrane receptor protein involved in Fe transport